MNHAFRSMQLMLVLVLALLGVWTALPTIVSTAIERWLEHQGYERVAVNVDRPGLRSLAVPRISLAKRLTGEMVTIAMSNAQAEYTLLGLLSGRVDRLTLRQVAIEILTSSAVSDPDVHRQGAVQDAPDSLLNALTAGDVLRRLPFFPWEEVRLEEVKLFREQATGPLRTVVIAGTIKHQGEALTAEMLLQGVDTIPYELRVTGQSPSDMSLQLRASQPAASPFLLWRSQAIPKDAQVQVEGILEVNVRELAPFLALLVPVGPEWQRVDGNVTVHWAGTAAPGVPVSTLLQDPATELHATVQVSALLPELKGYGKDLTVRTTGTLSGNARLILDRVTAPLHRLGTYTALLWSADGTCLCRMYRHANRRSWSGPRPCRWSRAGQRQPAFHVASTVSGQTGYGRAASGGHMDGHDVASNSQPLVKRDIHGLQSWAVPKPWWSVSIGRTGSCRRGSSEQAVVVI
jgi:hypothetical protein